jgi:hypothetical protein
MQEVKRRYFYQAKRDTSRHRGKRSLYLVEHLAGAGANIRVEYMGYVKGDETSPELSLFATQRGMSLVGDGQPTERHLRLQVILGTDYEEVK